MAIEAFRNGEHDLARGIDFIGVSCAFVCHDGHGRIVLHKRSQYCRDEQGCWDNGGGAHEFGDDIEQTIRREIREEYGAEAVSMQFVKVFDAHRLLKDGTPTHWVAILYAVEVRPEEVKNNEPRKIDDIGWFTIDALPTPLHSQTRHNLSALSAAGILPQ